MQTINIRYKLHLYWGKVILIALGFIFLNQESFAQARFNTISKAGQDDRFLSYGFFLAGHTNYYQIKYSEAFMDPNNVQTSRVRSVVPIYSPGFSLGFLAVFRIHDQFNILLTPKIGFYEFRTDINYFDDFQSPEPGLINTPPDTPINTSFESGTRSVVTETTMIELPLIFKYKAQRFNNNRMFFTGGGSVMWRTKDQEEADLEPLVTTGRDFTLDIGMGFDLYFKYFKFSPEIRFSHGLVNLYRPEETDPAFRDVISELRRKTITLYLHFQ
ncbi:outer membrane beta-barrel protein [Mongoliibacter ruber]|uniref:Outer membrane protein with beta-barrel domain n=1 Tax=Mongoliibacter ruber TaxID=1750599 RepID=A0A2T0WHP1_9BACT|nr:outer membrane beta-barrel protein [Mongoliibacter ruber]PRY86241.1 outer membrane protein with beta-barrel domain [Mongoliibacter ruber]